MSNLQSALNNMYKPRETLDVEAARAVSPVEDMAYTKVTEALTPVRSLAELSAVPVEGSAHGKVSGAVTPVGSFADATITPHATEGVNPTVQGTDVVTHTPGARPTGTTPSHWEGPDRLKLLNGFPRTARFLAADPDKSTVIFRRFDEVSIRNLLYLEGRVAALEALQRKFDQEDFKYYAGNEAISKAASSWEFFALLGASFEDIDETSDTAFRIWSEERVIEMERVWKKYESRYRNAPRASWRPEIREIKEALEKRHGLKTEGDWRKKNSQPDSPHPTRGTEPRSAHPRATHGGTNKSKPQRGAEEGTTKPEPPHGIEHRISEQDPQPNVESPVFKLMLRAPTMPESSGLISTMDESTSDGEAESVYGYGQYLGYSAKDVSAVKDRWNVARALQRALKDYEEAMLRYNQLLKLEVPAKRSEQVITSWVQETQPAGQKTSLSNRPGNLPVPQFLKGSAMDKVYSTDERAVTDRVSLGPIGSADKISHWLSKSKRLMDRGRDPRFDYPGIHFTPEKYLQKWVTVFVMVFAAVWVIGAIWFLWLVETEQPFEWAQLILLSFFIATFGLGLTFGTTATRDQIFGATAAYAAVLVVFIGTGNANNGSNSGSPTNTTKT
ncbi:hypothetical protein PV11_03275 [Exophiala sideris]|uniref:DUF6594 domain-containing protein n=1 Tax=Exophiala sideris TaxID=1016849 RepID=A0A0D1YYR0_9EURO|nr:hypothetical protein PV11_03275 [Exophiala sideris]